MFHMDSFYNEMLEKINDVEVILHGKMIEEKELKKEQNTYNSKKEKIENVDKF